MADELQVLVVDDDPGLLAILVSFLQHQGHQVLTAANGQEALALVMKNPATIGVVVCDIMMPVMNGYDFCRTFKGNEDTSFIPLMFVSALTDLDEKIKGYGVGADDYIGKPVSPVELGLKVQALLEIRKRNSALREELTQSRQVALQAMSYSSDLGQVLEFYKSTLIARDFDQIAQQLFQVTSANGLRATLQILSGEERFNFGDRGAVTPLESNVIELSRTKGRFFDFDARTVVNHRDFSLLIKNMPVEDQTRYGILKDTLGALCNAIEARVQFLLYESATQQKKKIVAAVVGLMEDIDQSFAEIQQSNLDVIARMMDELDNVMLDLGLTSRQENLIRSIAVKSQEDMNTVFKSSSALYAKFDQVRERLDDILSGKG